MTYPVLSPTEWSARVDYDSWPTDPTPRERIALHYNGPALTGYTAGVWREKQIIRGMENWHIDGNGWSGLGYGYGIGYSGTIYRARADARLGAHAGDFDRDGIPENRETDAVVLLLGKGQAPSQDQYLAFEQLRGDLEAQNDRQQILIGHREIALEGTGTVTECPGDIVMSYVVANRRLAPIVGTTPIIGPATVTLDQARAWLTTRGAHPRMLAALPLWFELAMIYGIDPNVAIQMSGVETWWGHYGRAVQPEQHNWAGIKTSDGAGFATFSSDRHGILAQMQHLRLYAVGPVPSPVDPRHFSWLAGTVRTVEALGGTWSTGRDYGVKIVALMGAAAGTVPPQDGYVDRSEWPEWAAEEIQWAIDTGIMIGDVRPDGTRLWRPNDTPSRAALAVVAYRLNQHEGG